MSRSELVKSLLQRYGNEFFWKENSYRGLFRALDQNVQEGRCYRLIASADFLPMIGDEVRDEKYCYTILRVDGVFLSAKRLYTWCIVEQKDGWERSENDT
jgi:hypothetical protein